MQAVIYPALRNRLTSIYIEIFEKEKFTMDMMKQFSLEGKVALITGAAYGIGFAIAEAYANCGAKIAFNCRGEKHMEEAMKAYADKGIDAKGYYCDVTNEEDVV